MFTKVLVGVNGEQGGRDAIALAKQLAHPHANIALAHVYGAGLMPGAGAALLLAAELEDCSLPSSRSPSGCSSASVGLSHRARG